MKFSCLSSFLVNSVDHVNSVKVINSGVETDLIQDGDTSIDSFLLECLHRVGDVGSGDNVLLELDGRLDDVGVLSVRDERDDEVVFLDSCVERSFIGSINSHRGGGAREGRGEFFGGSESSATCTEAESDRACTERDGE